MFKMSYSRENHRYTVIGAIFYGFIVPYGSPGLNNRFYTGFMGYLHTVGKGK